MDLYCSKNILKINTLKLALEQSVNTVVKEQQININGFTIRYFTAGDEGLPLVLLHGNAASALDWSWVLPKLATQYRVYAPDFPGFGDSSKPNLNYSLDFLTQFLTDFLDALEIERAVVAGNSLGGIVALRFALSNSDRVASLVLVDSSGLGYVVTPLLSQLTLAGYGEDNFVFPILTSLGLPKFANTPVAGVCTHVSSRPYASTARSAIALT